MKDFKEKVKELHLLLDQIHNAHESSPLWRMLLDKTFISFKEASVQGRKVGSDRIAFMPCFNATGMYKLDFLVIGKTKNPKTL